jgi:hypothetical protein
LRLQTPSEERETSVGLALPQPRSLDEALAQIEQLRELAASLIDRNAQLQRALDSRIVIEQAKGIISGRFGLDVDEAFEHLRRASRNNRLPLHRLAAGVVAEQRLLLSGAEEPLDLRSKAEISSGDLIPGGR